MVDAQYEFNIEKLEIKKHKRFLHIAVDDDGLHLTNSFYVVKLAPSMENIDQDIAKIKDDKLQFESQEQDMLDEVKIETVKEFDEHIEILEKERKEMLEDLSEIEFTTKVVKIDDSQDVPKFVMLINSEAVEALNRKFERLANYLITITPSNDAEEPADAVESEDDKDEVPEQEGKA